MARENQTLQIALIVFVILWLAFLATTFVFYRQYDEAKKRATANAEESQKHQTAAKNTLDDNNFLKGKIGFAATENRDSIDQEIKKDMTENLIGSTIN